MDAFNLVQQFKVLSDEILSYLDEGSIYYKTQQQKKLLVKFLEQNPSEELIDIVVDMINKNQKHFRSQITFFRDIEVINSEGYFVVPEVVE